MRVDDPQGSSIRIHRVWWPWRRRLRDGPDSTDGLIGGGALGDDPVSALIALFLLVLLLPVLLFFLLAVVHTERVSGWFASRRRMLELGELARTGHLAYLGSATGTAPA